MYHRDSERIANVVYADRMGNGDTSSGDGWKCTEGVASSSLLGRIQL